MMVISFFSHIDLIIGIGLQFVVSDFQKMQEEPKIEEVEDAQKENKPSKGINDPPREQEKKKSELNKSKQEHPNQQMQIYSVAFVERKSMNMERLKEYMKKRKDNFQERSRIYTNLKNIFFEKQKHTKNFLKTIIKYFSQLVDLYQYYTKSLSKFELKKKPKESFQYEALQQAFLELTSLNDAENQHVQKFIDWIEKILISAFHSAQNLYKDRIKKLNNNIEKSDDNFSTNWSKEEKAYEKVSTGNDLLEKQLFLIEKIKISNQSLIGRGLELYAVWNQLLDEEKSIKKIIKENILQFHERFIAFHKKSDKANSLLKYWKALNDSSTATEVFASVLDEKDVEFISFGCRTHNLSENMDSFLRLVHEQKRIGNPIPYLDILINKKFKAKLQKSAREWDEIRLIFTVDQNLLVYDQKETKTVYKLKQGTLKIKRISENILELSGVEEGFIIDSNKKLNIHFESLDSVQEFVYFMETICEPEK